jgi:DNA-binding CsgD family transcriptional regulator
VDNGVSLSPRERQILALVAEGATDSEIARHLTLSRETVSWYVKQIRARLDARSRAHAVALALREDLLPEMLSGEGDA